LAPSTLAGEGWDGREQHGLDALPALTPTLALPRQGGGDPLESPQDLGQTLWGAHITGWLHWWDSA